MKGRARSRAGLPLALILALACTTDPASPPIVPVASLAMLQTPSDGVYLLGYTRQLVAEVLDPDLVPLTDRRVSWRSSNATVATISAEGVVEGLAVGTTTITLRSEGITTSRASEVREGIPVPEVGAPATASILGGLLELSVPVGVAVAGFPIHARVPTSWPTDDRLVPATVVALGPTGTELAAPIVPSIAFEPTGIPAIERPNLRLFAVGATGVWTELPGGVVDLAGSRVAGNLSRLTTVAVFRRATPTELVKVAGDNQVVPRGTAVPITPTVVVRDASGRPVSGIVVTFSLGPGGGQLTGTNSATSGLEGTASVPGQWRVGSSAGTYTLTATIAGGIQVTFTATATP